MDQSLEINIASLALLGVFLVVSLVLTLLLICRIPYSKVREGLFWVRLSAILINLYVCKRSAWMVEYTRKWQ